MKQQGWRYALKRTIDVVGAASAIAATAPVLGAASVAVLVALGRPVFFTQTRPGRGGRPFTIWKLRTMTDERDASGQLLPDTARLTRLGRALRAASVDELPQLWNVLRGDMSLVGPRPLLVQYLPLYSPEQARRHDVLPGITGWAQIHGRNATDWPTRLALDVWYVDHWSLALDARILVETLFRVVAREGVAHPGHDTMPYFTGADGV